MSEMIERVALALFKAEQPEQLNDYRWEHTRANYILLARAAIAAMREPTEEMKSVDEVHWDYSCHVCGGLKDGWHKMIDAALEDNSTCS